MKTWIVTKGMLKDSVDMFPELSHAKRHRGKVAASARSRRLMRSLASSPEDFYPMPAMTYTLYREFVRTGDRGGFEGPYFARRRNLTAAVGAQFLRPAPRTLDAVHDYLWAICEESTWILPAHERGGMDLFATETAFSLAEAVALLRGELAGEVVERVEAEIRRRILDPYLAGAARRVQARQAPGSENLAALALGREPQAIPFGDGHNNWTGVCASSVGAVLLYLEPDPARLTRGLNLVLASLGRFIERAFAEDGASDEGVAYWHYGLFNFVAFSELLRQRTRGKMDLLAHPKMKAIAAFPLTVRLSAGWFYSHADCSVHVGFHPGILCRLAGRTGVRGLKSLADGRVNIGPRVPMLLRDLLWWSGASPRRPAIDDRLLPAAGIFRMRSGRLMLAGKAGHNAENHNHNDVGSFVLHAAGEDLLCDPGAPAYCRDFFSPRRYEFLQARSRGHSVPVIGGREQAPGREFRGEVLRFGGKGGVKHAELELGRAYPVKSLRSLKRLLTLAPGGRFRLEDRFDFNGSGLAVEEALVTWLPVAVKGNTAIVRGERSALDLRIVQPEAACFHVEAYKLAKKGEGPRTLRRLTIRLPPRRETCVQIQGRVILSTTGESKP